MAFSSLARILGECSTVHSPPALLCFKVEISSRTLIPLFRSESVNGGSASSDDCDLVFPDELHVSSFPDRSPDYAWTAALSAHSDFVGPKVYACLGVSCQLHVLQNGQLPK